MSSKEELQLKIEELKKLSEAGTRRPWKSEPAKSPDLYPTVSNPDGEVVYVTCTGDADQNAKLIATMRNSYDDLLAVAEAARDMQNNSARAPLHAWEPLNIALKKLEDQSND